MSKCFQILLTGIYIILTSSGVICLLRCWGLPISRLLAIELLLAWTAVCFSLAYFLAGLFLATCHVRKPVKAEEDQLNACFAEVLHEAGIGKRFRLLIQEEMGYNAFATGLRTIVVTRGLLENMESAEIKGILAHELGHLLSGDCLIGAVFASAGLLPLLVTTIYERGTRILLQGFRLSVTVLGSLSRYLLPVFIIGLSCWIYSRHFLVPVTATGLFVWLFRRIRSLFNFWWRTITRFREYKQDAYASALGYGPALRQALLKGTVNRPQSVSLYDILLTSDHPVIYNRIRRLEKSEGLS